MFFYEGRTIRGLGITAWALLIQLGAVVATGAALGAVAIVLGPALVNPSGFLSSVLGIVAAVCGIELGQVAVGVIYLVGFADLHAGRHEYGLAHARAIDRATVCLVIFAALTVFATGFSVSMNLFGPSTGVPAESFLTGNLVLAPIGAFVAGLSLYYAVRAVADEVELRRLRIAVALGVAGSIIGPVLLAFSVSMNPRDVSSIVTGLLASAVAGDGICAISLLLIVVLFREVRQNLVAGRPAPALPRVLPPFPQAWPIPPPAPAPPAPVEPPKSRL